MVRVVSTVGKADVAIRKLSLVYNVLMVVEAIAVGVVLVDSLVFKEITEKVPDFLIGTLSVVYYVVKGSPIADSGGIS